MYPDEPSLAVVYVQLPRQVRTSGQWVAHLTLTTDLDEVEVVIEPAGERAAILLRASGGSGPAALERAVDRLVSDPRSFGLVDAARTRRTTD